MEDQLQNIQSYRGGILPANPPWLRTIQSWMTSCGVDSQKASESAAVVAFSIIDCSFRVRSAESRSFCRIFQSFASKRNDLQNLYFIVICIGHWPSEIRIVLRIIAIQLAITRSKLFEKMLTCLQLVIVWSTVRGLKNRNQLWKLITSEWLKLHNNRAHPWNPQCSSSPTVSVAFLWLHRVKIYLLVSTLHRPLSHADLEI